MPAYKNLPVDRIGAGDRIAWITLNCPAKANALSEDLFAAVMSFDYLAMLKPTMNRFDENMEIYSSIRSATEQDVMAQMTEFACDFGGTFEEIGMKAAIERWDRPYDRKGY